MSAVRILDRVIRPAPIGLRFRDVATGMVVREGLTVTITSLRNPLRTKRLDVNGSGVWYAHRFPGYSDEDLAIPTNWPALAQPCRISVDDALGRFLPLRLDMDLPVRGLASWPGWSTVPQALLAPLVDGASESPPDMTVCRDALPLFSSPERSNPAPLAEIRCQLRRTSGEPASGALMTVGHSGTSPHAHSPRVSDNLRLQRHKSGPQRRDRPYRSWSHQPRKLRFRPTPRQGDGLAHQNQALR